MSLSTLRYEVASTNLFVLSSLGWLLNWCCLQIYPVINFLAIIEKFLSPYVSSSGGFEKQMKMGDLFLMVI